MAANRDLKPNNMDAPPHKEIYEQGYEMRKKVVGEEYVEKSLKASGSDFMRPLQQFATVWLFFFLHWIHCDILGVSFLKLYVFNRFFLIAWWCFVGSLGQPLTDE
jgi:hypothetical protein